MKYLLALLFCTSAHAQFYDGNKLFERLQSRGNSNYMGALGYILGVTDSLDGVAFCAPAGVTAGQVADMVQRHLESVPASRHLAADVHVAYVLKQAWPCQDSRKGSKSL